MRNFIENRVSVTAIFIDEQAINGSLDSSAKSVEYTLIRDASVESRTELWIDRFESTRRVDTA